MRRVNNSDLAAAAPGSIPAAQNSDVEKAIEVLGKEAACAESDWDREMLEACALYLEDEAMSE